MFHALSKLQISICHFKMFMCCLGRSSKSIWTALSSLRGSWMANKLWSHQLRMGLWGRKCGPLAAAAVAVTRM